MCQSPQVVCGFLQISTTGVYLCWCYLETFAFERSLFCIKLKFHCNIYKFQISHWQVSSLVILMWNSDRVSYLIFQKCISTNFPHIICQKQLLMEVVLIFTYNILIFQRQVPYNLVPFSFILNFYNTTFSS